MERTETAAAPELRVRRPAREDEPSPQAEPKPLPEVVYTPQGHIGLGWAAWREMIDELVRSRELTWRLFLRDFSARYRQSILGYAWAVLPVLVTVITFTWLNRAKVIPIREVALPYPVFVLLGMTVWQLFASGLTTTTQSLVNAGSLITKINFPRETLVLAAFGQSLFEFLVRVVLVAAAFVVYRVAPAWTVVLIPLALVPLALFTLGLGFIASLANGVFRDAAQGITFVLTFWMFLTPVVYPAPADGGPLWFSAVNPVAPFVMAAQDLTTRGFLAHPAHFGIGTLVSVAVFLLGWRVFHLTEPRIAERV
jgi:lipopolysaccharide transport system permease protein